VIKTKQKKTKTKQKIIKQTQQKLMDKKLKIYVYSDDE